MPINAPEKTFLEIQCQLLLPPFLSVSIGFALLTGLRQECTKGNGSLKLESLVQEESKLLRIRLATCLEIVFTLPWVQVAGVVILQI